MNQLTRNTILGFLGIFAIFGYAEIKKLKKGGLFLLALFGSAAALSYVLPEGYGFMIVIGVTAANVLTIRKWTKEYQKTNSIIQ